MAFQVIMPQLGESVNEGTLTKWLKRKGDRVEEFEPLFEINTDKVDTEIPSPSSGILLEILVDEGNTIEAGTLLAWIGEAEEQIPRSPTSSEKVYKTTFMREVTEIPAQPILPTTVSSAPPSAGRDSTLGFISPVVAKIASENKVNLFDITGTGKNGRITKNDVLNYIDQTGTILKPALPPQETGELDTSKITLSPIRQQIAEHMLRSKHTSPHVTTVMEADMSSGMLHRSENKDEYAKAGVNLTFTTYFAAASVQALKKYQIVNSSWSSDGIVLHRDINIGIAVSLGADGLIVPVIRRADSLSLFHLADEINKLTIRARQKQLLPDDVQNGTFTITNHGVNDSLFATPIINQPQCAILGVGVIQKRVVVINDAIAIRPMVYISLTFDHRIIDGAIADHFLSHVIEFLQGQWKE